MSPAGLACVFPAQLGSAASSAGAWAGAAVARLGSGALAAGPWADAVLARLLWASLAGALAIALVALVVRLAPRLPPSLRMALWWLACLKLVLALVPLHPLALPLPAALAARLPLAGALPSRPPLSAALPSRPPGFAPPSTFRGEARLDPASAARRGAARPKDAAAGETAPRETPAASSSSPRPFPWLPAVSLALVALWMAGLAAGLRDLLRQLAAARHVLRGARPAGSPALIRRFAELSAHVGLARPPALLVSAEVASPLAIARAAGLGAPAVVLPDSFVPAGCEIGTDLGREMDMALCHELAHVRRGDLRLGWVPALAARLFFFHPLARLAVREHALAREAACDAFVLARLDAPPAAYARLLLGIGAVAAGRLSGAAALGAAPSSQTLKRRLLMLDAATRRPRPLWLALGGLAALAVFVPLRITAEAPASPAVAAPSATSAPAAAPVIAAAPARAVAPALAAAPSPATAPATAPVMLAMASPAEHATVVRSRRGEESYVLLSKDGDVEMSGSTSDAGHARELAGGGSLLWFRRGGREYVVRDPALLAQVDALFAPQRELGKKQGALGAKQGELGARQGALGAKQGALGGRMASLALRGDAAERERDDISRQMEDLGSQQEALGSQQEELGRKQEALGREQERASREAEAKLKPLLDDAIARGVAQEVR